MANKVYRGPVDRQPKTISLPVSGALLPSTFVDSDGSQLSQKTTGTGRVLVLGNREFYGQDNVTAYADTETGNAYRAEPDQEYQVAMAAGTYTHGQELTIGASGRAVAAASTDVVVAYFDGAGATLTAGDLADVVIANSYVKA